MQFKIGWKNIGTLENGVFFKEVLSKHIFLTLDAWGIDSKTLLSLPEGTKIVIHELDNDTWYRTTKENFIEHGQYFHFKGPKADHRTQLFLSRRWFQNEKPKELTGDELEKHNYMVSQGLA